jgi:mRNA interferase RelE/StbE
LTFEVKLSKRAHGELLSLDLVMKSRIVQRLEELQDDPFPSGVVKLQGRKDTYRTRVGDYRILYEVRREEGLVLVEKIDHRSGVYGP